MRQLPNRQKKYFNPRSHEGSDILLNYPRRDSMISIRAPTKGATYEKIVKSFITKISIHAPTKGATAGALNKPMSQMISIHAPTKGATLSVANSVAGIPISIHAPTKGATLRNIFAYQLLLISIHAPTKGATHTITGNGIENIFQSTLPRRERQQFYPILHLIFFNFH